MLETRAKSSARCAAWLLVAGWRESGEFAPGVSKYLTKWRQVPAKNGDKMRQVPAYFYLFNRVMSHVLRYFEESKYIPKGSCPTSLDRRRLDPPGTAWLLPPPSRNGSRLGTRYVNLRFWGVAVGSEKDLYVPGPDFKFLAKMPNDPNKNQEGLTILYP